MIHILVIDTEHTYKIVKRVAEQMRSMEIWNILIDYDKSIEVSWSRILDNPFRYDAVMIDIGQSSDYLKEALYRAAIIYEGNSSLKIIFLTGLHLIPREVWQVPHVYIMKKPVTEEETWAAFERIYKVIMENEDNSSGKIAIRQGKIMRMIPQSEIIYGKKFRKGMILVTEEEEIYHTIKMEEFINIVSGTFCRCHGSYIVNFRHVVQVEREYLLLDNGETVTVSRSCKKYVQDYLNRLRASEAKKQIRKKVLEK